MTYLGSDRFVTRELEGYANVRVGSDSNKGLTITIIDRAYCGAVMRMWRSEERGGKISAWMKRAEIRSNAAVYAAELNARTGASTS